MDIHKRNLAIGMIAAVVLLAGRTAGEACEGSPEAMFIDGMIIHHYASIRMAEQALKESGRPEITALAGELAAERKKELVQLKAWLKDWYPGIAPTGGMGVDMGPMKIDPDQAKPFDLRFLEAMIPLEQGCAAMAKKGARSAQHEEIAAFAAATLPLQESRVKQLKKWKKAWFGK